MPRRGECIYKRKDGRWEARYVKEVSSDGKKKYGSLYASSYRDVKEKQRLCLQQIADSKRCAETHTVDYMLAQWIDHIQTRVKPSTFQKYVSLVKNHLRPALGHCMLNQITQKTIEILSKDLESHGRISGGRLSRKTVNDILVVLSLAMEYAEEEWGIPRVRIRYLPVERREARVLMPEEERCLVDYLRKDMDVYKLGVMLSLYTGLRIGELCALRWEDVTEERISVCRTMQRLKQPEGNTALMVGSPKTGTSCRLIPIPAFLQPYLEEFRRSEGYVIAPPGRLHTEPRSMQYRFARMTADCDLEGVTFHTLRHTFATRCVESGFDMKSLSEILGHSDVKTTLNRYVHSSFSQKKKNMEKLSFPGGAQVDFTP